jgi:hypothetical protein
MVVPPLFYGKVRLALIAGTPLGPGTVEIVGRIMAAAADSDLFHDMGGMGGSVAVLAIHCGLVLVRVA